MWPTPKEAWNLIIGRWKRHEVYFQDGGNILAEDNGCNEGDDGFDMNDDNGVDTNEYSSESLMANPDDFLPPVARLLKYVKSDIIFHRQVVARSILETLRTVVGNDEEIAEVTNILCGLMTDAESCVRCELMEQMPHIASFCQEHPSLANIVPQYVLPTIVKYLGDPNGQVRKSTQAAVLVMVEQGYIDRNLVEELICPVIVQLTGGTSSKELRLETFALMIKMATLMGKETAEYFFLSRFEDLCKDNDPGVRKVCIENFGEFCGVVGRETTEKILWPRFCSMCDDPCWAVRKVCPDAMVAISCVCSMQARHHYLAPVYLNLLRDQSKWEVQSLAYTALGPFISTFADPAKTGLYYTEDGVLIAMTDGNDGDSVDAAESSKNEEKPQDSDGGPDKSPPDKLQQSSNCCSECQSSDRQGDCSASEQNTTSDSQSVINVPATNSLPEGDNSQAETEITNEEAQPTPKHSLDQDGQHSLEASSDIPPPSLSVNRSVCDSPQTNCSDGIACCRSQLDCVSSSSKLYTSSRKESSADSPLTVTAKHGHLHVHIDSESAFNAFQFWRVPIPDLQLDIDIEEGGATSVHVKAKIHDDLCHQIYASNLSVKVTSPQKAIDQNISSEVNGAVAQGLGDLHLAVPKTKDSKGEYFKEGSINASQNAEVTKVHVQAVSLSTVSDLDCSRSDKSKSNIRVLSSSCNEADVTFYGKEVGDVTKARLNVFSPDKESPLQSFGSPSLDLSPWEEIMSPEEQDIVPPGLIEHYLKMVDPALTQVVDGDLAHHCAFSFPGVALTLGRKNWLCLKHMYETLASNMQWKVRWTLACSLHEVATILGSELTATDLLPVFSGFLRDLDEVRVGVLQHLYQFLKVVPCAERRLLLPRLSEFLKMDNERNWRFRFMLAEQLIPIVEICNPADVKDYLLPIGLALLRDKVSEVRRFSIRIVAVMIRRISQNPDANVVKYLLVELAERLTRATKWLERQTYAILCQYFLIESSIPLEQFAAEILPHLLYLCWDGVPNVRLAVARCLTETLLCIDFFLSDQNPHQELVMQALQTLQIDPDNDVRFYACLYPYDGTPPIKNRDPPELVSKSSAELMHHQREFLIQRTRYYLDKIISTAQEGV